MTTKINLLRREANLSKAKTAELCGVTERTIRNWERGKTHAPESAIKLIGLFCGQLDFIGHNWHGYRIDDSCIVSRCGNHLHHFEIDALAWLYQSANIKRHKLCKNLDDRLNFSDLAADKIR